MVVNISGYMLRYPRPLPIYQPTTQWDRCQHCSAPCSTPSSIASLDYAALNVTLSYRITVAYLTNLAIRIIFWQSFLPIFSSQILNPNDLAIRTLRNAEHTESISRTVNITRSTTTAH